MTRFPRLIEEKTLTVTLKPIKNATDKLNGSKEKIVLEIKCYTTGYVNRNHTQIEEIIYSSLVGVDFLF